MVRFMFHEPEPETEPESEPDFEPEPEHKAYSVYIYIWCKSQGKITTTHMILGFDMRES